MIFDWFTRFNRLTFIFDFDSTISSIEVLDTVISSKKIHDETKKTLLAITEKALNGEIDFHDSITQRFYAQGLNLLDSDFVNLALQIKKYIAKDIKAVIDYIKSKNYNIFILSAGFKKTIIPVAKELGINPKHVFANTYKFNKKANKLILNESPLLYNDGKDVIINRYLHNYKTKIMIGDGMSDAKTYLHHYTQEFIAYTEFKQHPKVLVQARLQAENAKELLEIIKDVVERRKY